MHSISMQIVRPVMATAFKRNFSKFYPRCRCAQNHTNSFNSDETQQHKQLAQPVPTNQALAAIKFENQSNLQIDWDEEMQQMEIDEKEHATSILSPVDERKIYAEPMLRPTYNLAAYVQKSESLQQLLKLGVDLHQLDRVRASHFIVNLDFKTDIEPYIMFLTKDVGIAIELLGKLFTNNPMLLREDLDDICTRINYLVLKRFTRDEIASIVVRNAFWLNYSTRDIDGRLGFFQQHFQLSGQMVRALTVACPKLITHKTIDVEQITFSIREECGFDNDQIKQLVQKCPKLWMMSMFSILNFLLLLG